MSRGKVAISIDLPQPLKLKQSKGNKQTAIYEALCKAILNGILKAGEHLPATRTLAERWQVSRGTVEVAFDRLQQEGYILRKRGSGSIVSAKVPDSLLRASSSVTLPANEGGLSAMKLGNIIADISPQLAYNVPFIARMPDPALLNLKLWGKCLSRSIEKLQPHELVLDNPFGLTRLRRKIVDYLKTFRGIPCEIEDVIVTGGIRNATDMVARVLLFNGDIAAIEDPGYLWARKILTAAGAKLAYIRLDNEGIDVTELAKQDNVKFVYVTPAHQSPLGITMTAGRRLELLDWAEKNKAFIIEDDYDSEFNYNSSPLPAIKAIDNIDRVIYCGSFNKTIFSDIKIGFCVIPKSLRRCLNQKLRTASFSTGIIEQIGMERFISEGYFAKHLRLARQTYQARRDLLIDTLQANTDQKVCITGQQSGFHFILWLPLKLDEKDFCAAAKAVGITLQPLQAFCHQASYPPAVVIGYTALSNQNIQYYAKKLSQILNKFN